VVALSGAPGDGCHALALRSDGSAAGWGYDGQGRVSGLPGALPYVAAVAGGHCSFALTRAGALAAAGYNAWGQCAAPPGAAFSRVFPGYVSTCALAAGIPQLIAPFAYDQFDNAARIDRMGAGRRVSARSASDWAKALRTVSGDCTERTQAHRLAQQMASAPDGARRIAERLCTLAAPAAR
jgi:hypothetical protein